MIFAYCDESGIHDRETGKAKSITVGGATASIEAWVKLESEWRTALNKEGISQFHMTDFEAYQGEFKGWNRERHKKFLSDLLFIIACYVDRIVGAYSPTTGRKGGERKAYIDCLRGAVTAISVNDELLDQAKKTTTGYIEVTPIGVVVADHPEVSEKLINSMDNSKLIKSFAPNIKSTSTANPGEVLPLQVADLIVFELARWNDKNPKSWRYPMKILNENHEILFIKMNEIVANRPEWS